MTSTTGPASRTVIVTGAGGGIGRATAVKFARQGAHVVLADLDEDGTTQTLTEVEAAGGSGAAVIGDLSDQEVVDRLVARALDRSGTVDVLVNNAGIMDRMSALGETDDAEWERVMRVNVTAPFLLTRAVLPHMTSAGGGAIVFTASEAGLRGGAAGAAYTASKHAVIGLVKNLAVMYRGQGIRANAVAPGPTETKIHVQTRPDAHGPTVVGPLIRGNIGRRGSADEQADAIVYLASDHASFINGAVVPVDDGWAAV